MRKYKITLYVIYFLYIGLTFIFILFTDRMFGQLGIQKTLDFLKYWAVFGLFLFLVEIFSENLSLQKRRKEIRKLTKENESLKAKIYDIEEKERGTDASMKAFEGSLKSKPKNNPREDNT